MMPPRLAKELNELRKSFTFEVLEDPSFYNVLIHEFPTGPHYSSPTTLVLLRVPRAYPDAALDMFWTEPTLTLSDGSIPQCGDSIEHYIDRDWRRFSWHHNGWKAGLQSLPAYLEFVKRRFHER